MKIVHKKYNESNLFDKILKYLEKEYPNCIFSWHHRVLFSDLMVKLKTTIHHNGYAVVVLSNIEGYDTKLIITDKMKEIITAQIKQSASCF